MTAVYPGTLATIAANKADATSAPTDHPNHHNQLAEELSAVQTTLGVNPHGGYSNVSERFATLDFKQSVKAASVANVTVANPGTSTFDGTALSSGDRILLKDQTTSAENGIYIFNGSGSAMTRATDADTAIKLSPNLVVSVEQGAINEDFIYMLTTSGTITLGTTALRFTRVSPPLNPQGSLNVWGGGMLDLLPRWLAGSSSITITSGTLYLYGGIVLPAGRTVTSISFLSNGAGVTLTNQWFCLVRQSDRAVLRNTSNDGAAAWAATTRKTLTLTSTYVADSDTPVYIGLMVAATTPPTMQGINNTVGGNGTLGGDALILAGTSNTGLTTPLTEGTIVTAPTAVGGSLYGYLK